MTTIRLLNSDDAQIFRILRIEGVNESPGAFGESVVEVTGKSLAGFVDHLGSHGRGDFVVGAFDESNNLIGMVGFYRAPYAKLSHKGTLWGMYVTPAERGKGVGRVLVLAAIKGVRNMTGVLQINLCVSASNTVAKHLYESLGFRIYGIEPNAIHIDGVYVDEVLMQFSLL